MSTRAYSEQGGYVPQSYGYLPQREPPTAWNSHQQQLSSHNQLTPVSTTSSIAPPFTRYETSNNAVDTAPFPGSSDQQPPAISHHSTGYSYTPEPMQQQWQPPQQHNVQQPVHRSISYPDYSSQNPYPQGFPSTHQQPSAFMQHAAVQPHQSGPRAIGLPSQALPPTGHQYAYQMPPDQRSSSIPAMAAYQPPATQMQQDWYPEGAYGPGGSNARGHDLNPHGGYARRPT